MKKFIHICSLTAIRRLSSGCQLSVFTAMLLAMSILLGCKPSTATGNDANGQEVQADSTSQTEEQPTAKSEETKVSAQFRLTFEQAKTMIAPGQKYDEQSIEALFSAISLPKVTAERYIWDADFGGDSPAISYAWGNHVAFKNWELTSTEADYYGVHFNFFFDDSRKRGTLKQLDIITDDAEWYERFMADAKAGGLQLKGNLDKAVHQREGKEYVLNTGDASQFFINDFTADGAISLEMGFDDGTDV